MSAAPVHETGRFALHRDKWPPLALTIPPELVQAIAQLAAEIVSERLGRANGSPWMTRPQAAQYLGLPVSRLEKDKAIPCHREGRRVLYHSGELDAYVQNT